MTEPPSFSPIDLRCAQCRNTWTGYIAIHCPITLTVASMEVLVDAGCPKCGATRGDVLWVAAPGPKADL